MVLYIYIYNFDGLVKFVVVLHSRQTGFGKSQKNLFDKKFIRSFCTPNSHWVIIRKMCHAAPGKMVHESIHFFNPGILDLLISSPYFVNCSVYRYYQYGSNGACCCYTNNIKYSIIFQSKDVATIWFIYHNIQSGRTSASGTFCDCSIYGIIYYGRQSSDLVRFSSFSCRWNML